MAQLISNIIEITHDSLKFMSEENKEEEISFLECSKNWVEYFNSRDDFVTWGDWKPAPKITFESNKCVGQRDWFADKPYYEFFTNPRICFEIRPKKRFIDNFSKYWKHNRYYKQFHKVTMDLESVGWTTFDLG